MLVAHRLATIQKGGPYRRYGKGRIVEQVCIRTSRKARLYALQFSRCHGEDGKAASLIVAPERACGLPKWTQAGQLQAGSGGTRP